MASYVCSKLSSTLLLLGKIEFNQKANSSLFQVIDVLSKLAGLWVNAKKDIMYSQASQITFICPMIFNYFPLDTQVGRCSGQMKSH